ncbi:hypothetical protein KIW84_065303 [Lathyrus oleraceus]|uniref:Putative plant transposon protein domain-containing protein n=1 Tax=Pisum sativum TaxID=3888 RepID=A0A9D4WE05_PEA|nr:hypothetical protein KIW84_065303 [Pisum sativum]
MKWTRFYQQPQSYNTQIVKEFYANLVDTNNKKCEVVVRGVKFSYSEGTINILFKLGLVEYRYQELLLTSYDVDYDVYKESLCNPDTKWVETGGEKTMKIMDLRSESKVWYKFIKHSLRLTTHNETVNKTSVPGASSSGVPKDDTTEKPRKKVRESKNPKQVNTTSVSIEDTIIKKEQKDKSDAGESSNKDGRTLQKLLYQATKDKK